MLASTVVRLFYFREAAFAARLAKTLRRIRPHLQTELEQLVSARSVRKRDESEIWIVVVDQGDVDLHFRSYIDDMESADPFFPDAITVADKALEETYFSSFTGGRRPFFVDLDDLSASRDLLS